MDGLVDEILWLDVPAPDAGTVVRVTLSEGTPRPPPDTGAMVAVAATDRRWLGELLGKMVLDMASAQFFAEFVSHDQKKADLLRDRVHTLEDIAVRLYG